MLAEHRVALRSFGKHRAAIMMTQGAYKSLALVQQEGMESDSLLGPTAEFKTALELLSSLASIPDCPPMQNEWLAQQS